MTHSPTRVNHSPTAKKAVKRATPPNREGDTRQISFTIKGNPNSPNGNPLPKARLTRRQQWTKKARDYVAWKSHVVKALQKALDANHQDISKHVSLRVARGQKPIPAKPAASGLKSRMSILCRYKNHAHPDTENVFGSIADALFENDSTLSGAFDYSVVGTHKTCGEVEVIITLNDKIWTTP